MTRNKRCRAIEKAEDIDWFIVSYDSANKQKQYKDASCDKETDCQLILE